MKSSLSFVVVAALLYLASVEGNPKITDVLNGAENERWMSALKAIRNEVDQHEDEVGHHEAKKQTVENVFNGFFQRLVDVQQEYEKAELVLLGFSFRDCSNPNDPVHLRQLSVSPDPIPLPGKIVVAASAEVGETVPTNLKVDVKMETEIFGHYFTIPCVDGFGSCTYEDLCSRLPQPPQPCPPIFVKAGIPCRCPFPAGKFHLPTSAINLPAVPLPIHSATIRLTAHLTADAKPITCIQIKARVEKKD